MVLDSVQLILPLMVVPSPKGTLVGGSAVRADGTLETRFVLVNSVARELFGKHKADIPVLIRVDERIGGDKRPTLRNSLVSGGPDLARGSEVFYYSSAGFLTVWQGQPSSR